MPVDHARDDRISIIPTAARKVGCNSYACGVQFERALQEWDAQLLVILGDRQKALEMREVSNEYEAI